MNKKVQYESGAKVPGFLAYTCIKKYHNLMIVVFLMCSCDSYVYVYAYRAKMPGTFSRTALFPAQVALTEMLKHVNIIITIAHYFTEGGREYARTFK